jgi:Xaa-Pro aminopeptidase
MTGDGFDFAGRLAAARRRLATLSADSLVCFPSRNLQYLCGHYETPGERQFLLFVPASGDPVFVVPELAASSARETPVDDVRTWRDETGPRDTLDAVVAELGVADGHLLVDDTMWARFTQDLRDVCPDATFGLASEALADLRVHKDDAELAAMCDAAAVADAVVERLRERGEEFVGWTEAELATEIERLLAAEGGEGVAFDTIVAAGPNGAVPHHRRSDREIRADDPVVLDFGTRVSGYPSDQTRTLVFGGDPAERVREVHDVVRAAQAAGVDAVEPGATAGDVDDAARSVIREVGCGDSFVHRTGHGVGLDVHEEPYIVAGNDRELEPGMVFSVEPGVYLDGEFGVRIEDLVVVTDDGCERLNHTPRGWRAD